MIKKIRFFSFILIFFLCQNGFSSSFSENSDSDIAQGYEAFKNKNWVSAAIFLRKAVSAPENETAENFFMLIKSEIYSGEYKMAENDCDIFLSKFPFSAYVPHIQYEKGRMLHLLGKNDSAVLVLSDFCKNHYDDELYPLALFCIAEAFYDEYNFEAAKGLFERIVSDFSGCAKAKDAQYKLDLISQRSREEKLLYLLKAVGEENLSTREEYERQIKIYEMSSKNGFENEIAGLKAKISALEAELEKKDQNSSGLEKDDFESAFSSGVDFAASAELPEEKKSSGENESLLYGAEDLSSEKNAEIFNRLEKFIQKDEGNFYLIEKTNTDGEK